MEYFREGGVKPALTKIYNKYKKPIFTDKKGKVDGFSVSKIKKENVKLPCKWIEELRSMTAEEKGF